MADPHDLTDDLAAWLDDTGPPGSPLGTDDEIDDDLKRLAEIRARLDEDDAARDDVDDPDVHDHVHVLPDDERAQLETDARPAYRVASVTDADRAAARFTIIDRKVRGVDMVADDMVDRVERWRADLTAAHTAKAAYYEGLLAAWLLDEIDADPKGPKSRTLPGGATVKSNATTPKAVVVDRVAFAAFAKSHPEVLKPPPPPPEPAPLSPTELAKILAVDDEGRAVIADSGLPVPGVAYTDAGRNVNVDLGDPAEPIQP